MKKVACVIVNYNDWKRTMELVERIVGFKCITWIIIVDNHSTDDSREQLVRYRNDKKIELIFAHKNGGYGVGNNVGIRRASELGCDYFLLSNPDVFFTEDCVLRLMNTISNRRKCAIVSGLEKNLGNSGWRKLSVIEIIFRNSVFFSKLIDKKRVYPQS